ncbi:MAG: hypothetical protein MJZ30_11445 [Paludibacteraceae bacterium]|nr:hypothetical protein [Paludibacteraceae bacterium]
MKKILFSLCAILLSVSSCSSASDDFLLTANGGANEMTENHVHVSALSNLEKWEQIPFIYDFRGWMVTKTWIDDDHYWMAYEDMDGFDFGDFSDGCPDMEMAIEVDRDSWDRFHQHFTPVNAMYCKECSLWHIYYDEFSYND